MNDQKLDNLLNLALDATRQEREASGTLDVGYDREDNRWDLIVRYTGQSADFEKFAREGIDFVPLLGGYAVVTLPEEKIEAFSALGEVIYVEKPKRLYFSVRAGKAASCVNPVQAQAPELNGRGVLIAVIDSGVDFRLPEFLRADKTTRFRAIWDQTIPGKPPAGYRIGTEYTEEDLNRALGGEEDAAPTRDASGHGTAVLGIAAGSGADYRGVAPESELLAVKLGTPRPDGFPRTTELMQGVDYAVKKGVEWGMPTVINLSFGNTYGSHTGQSLVETYLNFAGSVGRTTVCVGSGNEGDRAGHASGILRQGETAEIAYAVGEGERPFNIQLWKQYQDRFRVSLIHPSGAATGPLDDQAGTVRFRLGNTELLIYCGMPSPYSAPQEIYMDFLPADGAIDSGVWKIRLDAGRILDGRYDLWLPGGGVTGEDTRFLRPDPETTLTIPSAASGVITVGAYDPRLSALASFSGRGYTRSIVTVKPDLAAPGTDIRAPRAGGGYGSYTGTSFAVPFVTGAAALLGEWGVVRGNDPFLFGEKIKSYLISGVRPLPGETVYPNPRVGWGTLCVRDSLPL